MIIRGNLKPRGQSIPAGRVVSRTQESYAIAAAIESRKARYIHLKCGHLTTWEAFQIYLVARPRKDKFYCETCHKWVFANILTEPRKVTEDEPMF